MDNEFIEYRKTWGKRDDLMLDDVDEDIRNVYKTLVKEERIWNFGEPTAVQTSRSLKKIASQLDEILKHKVFL